MDGSFLFGMDQMLFRGKALDATTSSDHDKLKPGFLSALKIDYPKPDGVLTFDRLSSVFLSNTNHEEEQPRSAEGSVGGDRGEPGQVRRSRAALLPRRQKYEIVREESGPRLQINAQNCIHCKTLRHQDPTQNINWVVPQGGEGPIYQGM